jgi:hypothetical protein
MTKRPAMSPASVLMGADERLGAHLRAETCSVEQGGLVDALDLGERPEVGLDQRLTHARRQFDQNLPVVPFRFRQAAQLEDTALHDLLNHEGLTHVDARTVEGRGTVDPHPERGFTGREGGRSKDGPPRG